MYTSGRTGYHHVAAEDQYDAPHDTHDSHEHRYDHNLNNIDTGADTAADASGDGDGDGDGDLGGGLGLPPPHMLEGSSYPTPTPTPPRGPPSVSSSSGGARSSQANHRQRQRQRHSQQRQQQRTFSLPPGPGVGAGSGAGSYTYRSPPLSFQGAAHHAGQGQPPPSESSSRRTRHSLPPPQSYPYARAQAPNQVGYNFPPQHQHQHQHQQQLHDPYSMPNYLYTPSPPLGAAPSVSSGASGSGSGSRSGSGRNDGIFAVAAPHHSLGQQNRSRYGGSSGTGLHSYSHPTPNHNGSAMAVGDVLPPFPPWSMAWYAGHMSADGHAYTMVPPNGSGAGDWESDTLTSTGYGPGFPNFRPHPHGSYPYPYGSGPGSGSGSGAGPADEMDPAARAAARKAARLRALEREFGLKVDGHGQGGGGGDNDDDDDDDAVLLEKGGRLNGGALDGADEDAGLAPGSITSQGRFVHRHPKMRSAVGIALLLLCILAFAIGAGGSYLIKLPATMLPSSAPAKGTIGSYLLYVISFLCMAISFYLFMIRPCCVDPMRRRRISNSAGGPGLAGAGGIVVPVLTGGDGKSGGGGLFGGGGGGGKSPKMRGGMAGRRGRRGLFGRNRGPHMAPAPTVNLIVDPRAMLGGGRFGDDDDDDDDDDEDSTDGEGGAAARLEKDALGGQDNSDLAGLIGGRLGAAAGGDLLGSGGAGLTKKQRRRQRRAARLARLNAATRRAHFQPFVLASLRTQAVWLCAQSALWLLAVVACLVPLFRSTSSSTITFVDAGTNQTSQRTVNSTRTALGAACPPRGGAGWCDAYNGARAASVIAMVVCMGLAVWAVQELGQAKKMARREGAGFRVR